MPGRIFKEKMWNNNLPPDTKLGLGDKGYIDDELALKYLWHFHHQTRKRQRGRYRLLIFDGHGSHCTYEFLSVASQLDIIVLCLPPHSTHLTQPLDLVCFSIEKHYHSKAIEEHVRHGKDTFTKQTFLQVLQQIRKLTFIKANIMTAFTRAGIQPFDPRIILDGLSLILGKKKHSKDVKGRIYGHDVDEIGRPLKVPASNEAQSRYVVTKKPY